MATDERPLWLTLLIALALVAVIAMVQTAMDFLIAWAVTGQAY